MNQSEQGGEADSSFLLEHADFSALINRLNTLDYGKTRNYLNGSVSRLSPFITHGILSTKEITRILLLRELEHLSIDEAYKKIEPFLFQMAWRDYFHRAWEYHQEKIFSDLNHEQKKVVSKQIPTAVLKAETGIVVLDEQLQRLYQTGYIHNHARMWIAAFVANVTGTDWRNAAAWFHYHLLDGDLASNTLSWQWIAGTLNKNKKHYIANQDNINKYSETEQSNTILDRSYEDINAMIPLEAQLQSGIDYSDRGEWQPSEEQLIPECLNVTSPDELNIQDETPVYLRNVYQLDPAWKAGEGQHILLIEPSMLEKHPLSAKRWQFIEHWALKIPHLQIVIARFDDFQTAVFTNLNTRQIFYREHPLSTHWRGVCEKRVWLFEGLEGDYPSFFKFWNKAKKQVKLLGVEEAFELDTLSASTQQ